MPKVSVVIPTYNRAHLLPGAIQSVLDQSFRDFEIIVIDDGSTDNTREIATSFPITYYYQENHGVATALNKGSELSSGDYLVTLGSDDALLPDALEKQVKVLDEYPDVGFVYGQANMLSDDGQFYRIKGATMPASAVIESLDEIRELFFGFGITPSASMMRLSAFRDAGRFDETLTAYEDLHLYMRLAKKHRAAYIAEPLVNYTVHFDGLHLNVAPAVAERAILFILQEVFDDPEWAPRFHDQRGRIYAANYVRIVQCAYGKDMRMTRRYIRKAIRVYPVLLLKNGVSLGFKYATSLLPDRVWRAGKRIKRQLSRYRE